MNFCSAIAIKADFLKEVKPYKEFLKLFSNILRIFLNLINIMSKLKTLIFKKFYIFKFIEKLLKVL